MPHQNQILPLAFLPFRDPKITRATAPLLLSKPPMSFLFLDANKLLRATRIKWDHNMPCSSQPASKIQYGNTTKEQIKQMESHRSSKQIQYKKTTTTNQITQPRLKVSASVPSFAAKLCCQLERGKTWRTDSHLPVRDLEVKG